MRNKSLYLEAKMLADFLCHPAGFNVDFGAVIGIRPVSEASPPKLWVVEWDSYFTKDLDSYFTKNKVCKNSKVFNQLHEAAYFFVQKRHELGYGLDLEKEEMETNK